MRLRAQVLQAALPSHAPLLQAEVLRAGVRLRQGPGLRLRSDLRSRSGLWLREGLRLRTPLLQGQVQEAALLPSAPLLQVELQHLRLRTDLRSRLRLWRLV
ncbi:MAG: hypothetical protein SFU86_19140 [Pirellulaceae bacterium]|nr:hypothetical protein [Pirellulaceae bacterium]